MNETLISARIDQRVHTIMDMQAQTHTLEMSNDILLLDGCPARLHIDGAELSLTTDAGTSCVTMQAFWYAFAGNEPTAIEAGRLLADSLMRTQALQQMRQLQTTYQHISEQIQTLGFVPLPTYRLSPFIEQALDAYDDTLETTQLLARILKQDVSTILAWAKLLGKQPSLRVYDEPDDAEKDLGEIVHPTKDTDTATAEKITVKRFRWTTDLAKQLEAAFRESTADTITATITEIAQRFDWPASAVQYKLYELQLPQRKQQQAQQREVHAVQEGD